MKTAEMGSKKRIGLALGGGGVRGLAHILVFEVLDDLGIKPSVIAGTSMGSIMGAAYAAGLSGREIRAQVMRNTVSKTDDWEQIKAKRSALRKWLSAFSMRKVQGGMVSVDGFLDNLLGDLKVRSFDELQIPLLVVATDYWASEQVVFESGDLHSAIKASIAFPGVLSPVVRDGRVLVDGGSVNNVPYDLVAGRCDLTVAIDVGKTREPGKSEIPGPVESVLGTFDIMHEYSLAERMRNAPPDIYVHPKIRDVGAFDLGKIDEVFSQAAPAIEQFRAELGEKLNGKGIK